MISFQELCLQYGGENNLTRTMLIDFIKQKEKYLQLCIDCKEHEIKLLEEKRELKQQQYDAHYQKLQDKYNLLERKWEEFSKCLDMGPEKFISMLDDLKEKIKSKGNEIAQLREQLKSSELDAKRYKNDGIQDRVKLQELSAQLESMIKMRDNWKADCEYNEKCFQAERDRRWELEEEVKQLKAQLLGNRLSIFEDPHLNIDNRWDGYCCLDLINGNKYKCIDMVKGHIDRDVLDIFDGKYNYSIYDHRTGDYLYKINKETYNIEKITHLKFEHFNDIIDCNCPCKKCKPKKTKIYLTVGLHKILVDTVDHEVDYNHYRLGEDSTKTRYVIVRKDAFRKDLRNYAINKETLKIKVID